MKHIKSFDELKKERTENKMPEMVDYDLSDEEVLTEMATFGVEKWGRKTYKIAVHGASSKDRPIPHIHIYLNNDINPYTKFNFEISLIDILCKDEINLIFQTDKKKNIDNRNRKQCTWTGYSEIKEGLYKFLFNPCEDKRFGDFNDNLERGIYEWNRETDYVKTINEKKNLLSEYFKKKGLIPLPKYEKYLKDYNEE